MKGRRSARAPLIWIALALAIGVPIALAAGSEQLTWRGPVYILAGFAGIIALGLVLVQPLLIGGYLPGLSAYRGRRAHHWIGGALALAVGCHGSGLRTCSPPASTARLSSTSPSAFPPIYPCTRWA